MSTSVYKVMEIIGSSPNSWEEAAKTAVEKAGIHREDLRVAEVVEFDMKIDDQADRGVPCEGQDLVQVPRGGLRSAPGLRRRRARRGRAAPVPLWVWTGPAACKDPDHEGESFRGSRHARAGGQADRRRVTRSPRCCGGRAGLLRTCLTVSVLAPTVDCGLPAASVA